MGTLSLEPCFSTDLFCFETKWIHTRLFVCMPQYTNTNVYMYCYIGGRRSITTRSLYLSDMTRNNILNGFIVQTSSFSILAQNILNAI